MENTIKINNENIDVELFEFLVPQKDYDENLEVELSKPVESLIIIDGDDADFNTEWLNKRIKARESADSISNAAGDNVENAA